MNNAIIPAPKRTGIVEQDIANIFEYIYKLQQALQFTLQNLDLKNVNRNALGACEIRRLDDGGVWIGSKLDSGKPGKNSNGIVIYADRGAKKVTHGTATDF